MKDRTEEKFWGILFAMALIVIWILFATRKIKRLEKDYNNHEATIAVLRDEIKPAMLDLVREVDVLRYAQAGDDYRRKNGDFNEDLMEIVLPKMEIGRCMECH